MSPSTQLFPEIQDATQVGGVFTSLVYLPIGVEGVMGSDGTATVGVAYDVDRPSQAISLFGATSTLTGLVNQLLAAGAGPVTVVASVKAPTAITLAARQAAWQTLESLRKVRIRISDTTVQADIVALAQSAQNANLMSHKQIAFAGMARGTTKAAANSAALAINHSRLILVAPGVSDDSAPALLRDGLWAAAAVAAEVAKSNDPGDDMDLAIIPGLTDVERDAATGLPVFRQRVVAGVLQNDFEDLLQGGVSPVMLDQSGQVRITHLRTTYTNAGGVPDTRWDGLSQRLIADQSFVLVRDYCESFQFLRKGNTAKNRALLATGIERGVLLGISDVLEPVPQPDGTEGYKVAVTASADQRQMIVTYQGHIVRGTQTILISPTLTINV